MEKISNFFSELKERISNPFILSYLIGWCIWNYRIVVGLVFYKNSELKVDGYNSFLDLILCNSSTWSFFWLPLFTAIGYTLLFPVIKNLILAFGVWNDTWGGNWNLNISKTKKVSSEKYLQYKIQYEEALEKITKYVNDEEKFNEQLQHEKSLAQSYNDSLTQTLKESENQKKFYETQLEVSNESIRKWEKINSIVALDGEWYLKITKQEKVARVVIGEDTTEYNVSISDGKIHMEKEDRDVQLFYITGILCNYSNLVVYLNKNYSGVTSENDIEWKFRMENKSLVKLRGRNNLGDIIELTKKLLVLPPHDEN